MSTAIYLRVSSAAQTTECQRPDIERACAARGLTASHIYEEQASAAKHRPEFERMMEDARAKKFTTLVIWALDRFGRSMAGNVRDVLELDKAGIKVVSVKEPWMDTEGPVRDLLVAIFGWVAQHERSRLIERTKAGIEVARARGKKIGRPSPVLKANHSEIVAAWKAEPDESRPGYRVLADRLGGVSAMTARKLAMAEKVS